MAGLAEGGRRLAVEPGAAGRSALGVLEEESCRAGQAGSRARAGQAVALAFRAPLRRRVPEVPGGADIQALALVQREVRVRAGQAESSTVGREAGLTGGLALDAGPRGAVSVEPELALLETGLLVEEEAVLAGLALVLGGAGEAPLRVALDAGELEGVPVETARALLDAGVVLEEET